MPAKQPAQIYKRNAIISASPGQLVLMLMDGAMKFTSKALEGLDNPDFISSQEIVHNNIIRTQAIINELQGTLDFEKGGDVAPNLFRVYDYLLGQLTDANTNKTKEPLLNVSRFLGEIRDSWAEMLANQMSESA